VGTLDNPGRVPPDVHIYTSTKAPWFTLPPEALVFEESYKIDEVWSEDSMRRRQALSSAAQR
jgi:hypothetical protein